MVKFTKQQGKKITAALINFFNKGKDIPEEPPEAELTVLWDHYLGSPEFAKKVMGEYEAKFNQPTVEPSQPAGDSTHLNDMQLCSLVSIFNNDVRFDLYQDSAEYSINVLKHNPVFLEKMLSELSKSKISTSQLNCVSPAYINLLAYSAFKKYKQSPETPNKQFTYAVATLLKILESTIISAFFSSKVRYNQNDWLTEREAKQSVKATVEMIRQANFNTKLITEIIKAINPQVKIPKLTKPTTVNPGEQQYLEVPDDELTPKAQSMVLTAADKKQAALLKKQEEKAQRELDKLEALKKKLLDQKSALRVKQQAIQKMNPTTLKYFSFIDKECSEFLGALAETGKLLVRGQNDTEAPIFVGKPRNDRKPKDSNAEAQKIMDDSLTMLGYTALRSNSLFCTTDENAANEFGRLYAIFPKNGFHFTWPSKKADIVLKNVGDVSLDNDMTVEELVLQLNNNPYFNELLYLTQKPHSVIQNNNIKSLKNNRSIEVAVNKLKSTPEWNSFTRIAEAFEDLNPNDWALHKLCAVVIGLITRYGDLASDFEYTLLPDSVVDALESLRQMVEQLLEDIESPNDLASNAKKIVDKYGLMNTDLVSAMKSGHEIWMHGEYIAVRIEVYGKELHDYFIKPIK